MRVLILIASLLHVAISAPQFVTFKDGKIGVNFAGYHAAAGLGGLLTGNGAHGGLSASAGTPWGPQAAAGLNGNADGRTHGVLFAGAEANPSVGASAVLGGAAGEGGFGGSESHSYGKTASKTITGYHHQGNVAVTSGPPPKVAQEVPRDTSNVIQKVKPPKKYSLIKSEHHTYANADVNAAHSKQVTRNVEKTVVHAPPPQDSAPVEHVGGSAVGVRINSSGGVVGQALQIPIGILRSLQESLSGIQLDKSISYRHDVYGAKGYSN